MSSTQILAQLVGAVGIALLLSSTLMRRRVMLLALDAGGSAVMGIHWALLGGTAGIAISAVVVVMDLAGTDPRDPRGRLVLIASLPVTAVLLAVFWTGPVDILAGLGLLGIALSRLSAGQIRLRALDGRMRAVDQLWGTDGVDPADRVQRRVLRVHGRQHPAHP